MWYNHLSELRTATATKETKAYLIENLCMYQAAIISCTPEKSNIKLNILNIVKRKPKLFLQPVVNVNLYNAKKVLIFSSTMRDLQDFYSYFDEMFKGKYIDYKTSPYAMYHSKTHQDVQDFICTQFAETHGNV